MNFKKSFENWWSAWAFDVLTPAFASFYNMHITLTLFAYNYNDPNSETQKSNTLIERVSVRGEKKPPSVLENSIHTISLFTSSELAICLYLFPSCLKCHTKLGESSKNRWRSIVESIGHIYSYKLQVFWWHFFYND